MSTSKNTANGIRRPIKKAMRQLDKEIRGTSDGRFGGALASEGYAGGYRQALGDVLLLLNGVIPTTRTYWEEIP